MDAYVLGAVPPYNQLLGAKLVSLLATSNFIRQVFERRYKNTKSVILGRKFNGQLALVTTTSALGRSSILNRLTYEGKDVFQNVGFTEGYGHFHLANGTFEKFREYLCVCGDNEAEKYRFGSGPNYRMRVVRKVLEHLHLPADLLRHGVKRGVYVAPLASNSQAFLRGEVKALKLYNRPVRKLAEFWKCRWLLPRSFRDQNYRNFRDSQWEKILELK
jgi:hypothetical protein